MAKMYMFGYTDIITEFHERKGSHSYSKSNLWSLVRANLQENNSVGCNSKVRKIILTHVLF